MKLEPMSAPDIPTLICAFMNLAFVLAIRMSAAMAKLAPPPAAGPLTAAMTGCGIWRISSMMFAMCFCRSHVLRVTRGSFVNSLISLRSVPAQKPLPAPVSITTRHRLSNLSSWSAFSKSRASFMEMALRHSGRLRVISLTPSIGSDISMQVYSQSVMGLVKS